MNYANIMPVLSRVRPKSNNKCDSLSYQDAYK